MKNNPFENLEGSALRVALETQAFSKTVESVERELDMQQKHDFAFRQMTIAEIEMQIENEIREFTASRREELKKVRKERWSIAIDTKRGYIQKEEEVYWVQDFENEEMVAYDINGVELKRRRMLGTEKQGMVVDLKQAM